jgi:hydrogenase maturation protease
MRILVAGVGNIFFGDDAFGVEVARVLSERSWPDCVSVIDFGIRGLDLTYALLDRYTAVILVDAVRRGGQPGTIYLIELRLDAPDRAGGLLTDAHGLDPLRVFQLASSLGAQVDRLFVVGCEPGVTGEDECMLDGLSEPVREAVAEAANLVIRLVGQVQRGEVIGAAADEKNTLEEIKPCSEKQSIQ